MISQVTKSHVANQMTSGRWLLTVTAGACLMLITIADCVMAFLNKPPFIDPAALMTVITMVFINYFNKPADAKIQDIQTDIEAAGKK